MGDADPGAGMAAETISRRAASRGWQAIPPPVPAESGISLDAPGRDHATFTRSQRLTLVATCFGLFMAMLDNTIVNVALPSIQGHLSASVTDLQWIVTSYTLPFACLLLSAGHTGDVKGRKLFFMLGLGLFTVASAACAVAPDMALLVTARCAQGVAAAMLFPSTLSIIRNTFHDEKQRSQAIGIWAAVGGIAIAGGPVLGGFLVDRLGWQSVFLVNLPIGILGLVAGAVFVPESKDADGRRLDLPGQILATAAVGTLTYALIEGNDLGWGSSVIVTMFLISGASLLHFLVVEARSPNPMLQLQYFRNRIFATANVVAFLLFFALFGVLFFISLFLQNVQGLTPIEVGVRFLPGTLTIGFTAPIAGKVAHGIGSRVPMTLGLAMMGIGVLFVGRVSVTSEYLTYCWALALVGIGMGLTMTPMTAAVMAAVPRERAGMASATTTTSREVGGVFGIALLGAVVTGQMRTALNGSLTELGIGPDLRTMLIDQATKGSLPDGSTVTGLVSGQLEQLSSNAFVHGLHVACTVAGIALLTGSVLALVGMRPPDPIGRHRRS